jgi:hypothetical protein
MDISWTATGSMLTGIGTLFGAISILWAAFAGRRSIKDLKESRRAERLFELSESISENAQLIVQNSTLAIWIFSLRFSENPIEVDFGETMAPVIQSLDDSITFDTASQNLNSAEIYRRRLTELKPIASVHLDTETVSLIDQILKLSMAIEVMFKLFESGQNEKTKAEIMNPLHVENLRNYETLLVARLRPHLSR